MVWMTAFIMFLWGSGLRIMSLYPDRQWKFGLIGLVAFSSWILADRLLRTCNLRPVPKSWMRDEYAPPWGAARFDSFGPVTGETYHRGEAPSSFPAGTTFRHLRHEDA